MTKDWLNNFVEKNAWSLLLALVGLSILYSGVIKDVRANSNNIKSIEEAQIVIIDNQQSIIELQVNQANLIQTVTEIKTDVKVLLQR